MTDSETDLAAVTRALLLASSELRMIVEKLLEAPLEVPGYGFTTESSSHKDIVE